MSSIDPAVLAAALQAVASAQNAMADAVLQLEASAGALDLGVTAAVLQAQVAVGDVLAAKVLPPQNGTDYIEILGRPVAAQLPPGVYPGESLNLQITGFSGTQIFVRAVQTPPSDIPVSPSPQSAPAPQQSAPAPQQSAPAARQAVPTPQSGAQIPEKNAQPPFIMVSRAEPRPMPSRPQAAPSPVAPPLNEKSAMPTARIAASQAAALSQRPAPPQTAAAATRATSPARAAQPAVPNIVQRVIRTVGDLLKAARVPDTPFTRTAAAVAPQAPTRISTVLQRLESALPKASDDARIQTLRTLLAFTSRIDPSNEETLPAQISSFVSNVVEGAEPKLSQLLRAHATSNDKDVHATPVLAQARAAERTAAIGHDLKSVVLSLMRDPPAERTPSLTQALNETLVTLTAAQLNVLSANAQDPGTISIALPAYFHDGGKPSYVRISRDPEKRAEKLDADNFHVAFVLDTANLGTVAIDLQSSGRSVKIDVKTQREAAAGTFSQTLDSLRSRLEDLRYRVASVTSKALDAASAPKPAARAAQSDDGLDLRA